MKAVNIDWDIEDGKDKDLETLPNEIEVPDEMTDVEEISDYITDLTEVCHFGFELVERHNDTFKEGKIYRQKVDSQQGYEDWEYIGIAKEAPSGELWYAFKNDLGVYYFDKKDLEEFEEVLI